MEMRTSLDSIKSVLDECLGYPVQKLLGDNLNVYYFGEQLFFQFHKGVYLRMEEDKYLFFNGRIIEAENGRDDFFLYVEKSRPPGVPHLMSRLFYRMHLETPNSRTFTITGYELHGLELADGETQSFAIILKDGSRQQLDIRFEFPAGGLHVSFGEKAWEKFLKEDPFGRKLKCMYST